MVAYTRQIQSKPTPGPPAAGAREASLVTPRRFLNRPGRCGRPSRRARAEEERPMNPIGCPSQVELSDFVLGNLPRAPFARVADHVEGCPCCQTSLQALDGLADSLVVRLRQPRHAGAGEADDLPP